MATDLTCPNCGCPLSVSPERTEVWCDNYHCPALWIARTTKRAAVSPVS